MSEEIKINLPYLLRSSSDEITYSNIIAFLRIQEPEGIQLDYKQAINANSLKKHFAAFSNKYGGIIIIGVEEDKTTGIPINTSGIYVDAKMIEQINQIASNVDPLPEYYVKKFEHNNEGFILIRVSEGGDAPYFVINDPNVYVRSGNITKDYVENATSEELKMLFSKKRNSELRRKSNEVFITNVLDSHIKEAEKNRLKRIENKQQTVNFKVGQSCSLVEVLVQPINPEKQLLPPSELKTFIISNTINNHNTTFPPMTRSPINPIPNGVSSFEWRYFDGGVTNFQLYSNGTVYYCDDVLQNNSDSKQIIYLDRICANIITCIRYARNFYSKTGYIGPVYTTFRLKDIQGILIRRITLDGSCVEPEKSALLNEYELVLNLNTFILNDNISRKEIEMNIIRELHWHFGFESESWEKIYQRYLIQI